MSQGRIVPIVVVVSWICFEKRLTMETEMPTIQQKHAKVDKERNLMVVYDVEM